MKIKNKKILLIIGICLVILIVLFNIIIRKNIININEKYIVKQMTESEQLSNLQLQINNLNAEHTNYANYIQTSKQALATAISNEGVATSGDNTFSMMAENIGKIVSAKTQATATEADVLKGKTAWVNGSKITGTNTRITELEEEISKLEQQIEDLQNELASKEVTGTWQIGCNFIMGYNGTNFGTAQYPNFCQLTMKDGNLSVTYFNDNYQSLSYIGKTFQIDPSNLTLTKIN